jgi:hypothetical protein
MATNIRSIVIAAGTTIGSRVSNSQIYQYPPDSVNQFPAIIPIVESLDMAMVVRGNSFQGTLRIICLVERAEAKEAWLRMYDMMDTTGSGTSVIAALKADPTLGTSVDSSFIASVQNIGAKSIGEHLYIGFDVILPFVLTVA